MYDGYHLLNKQQALQVLNKTVYIPQARIGVGEGESLFNHNIKIDIVRGKEIAVLPELARTPFEKAHLDGQSAKINPEDFPKSGYLGEQLGEI